MNESATFTPDWFSAPGETVADILEEQNLTVQHLADRMGESLQQVMDLIEGRASLTARLATQLELIFGPPAAFWMAREAHYRVELARLQARSPQSNAWLAELPIADMMRFGWIPKVGSIAERVAACLQYFGTKDPEEWRARYDALLGAAAYRTSPSFVSGRGATAAWLRQGEIKSAEIACQCWDPERFRELLPSLRSLTRKRDPGRFVPELTRLCAGCGVAVVIARAPEGCRASGATRFLSPRQALILLSFRYLSDDHFWFTFFHEAAHLILHGEKAVFLEGLSNADERERQANEFAARVLVPEEFDSLLGSLTLQAREVIRFSQGIGVSPGIIVGQLQHRGILRRNQLNSLKRRFQWE